MIIYRSIKQISIIHVGRLIDGAWELLNLHLESALDIVENIGVFLRRYERDGEALGTESASSSDSVKILISLVWHVKVDDDVDSLNIDTSSEKVGADHDSVLARLELLENSESLAHVHASATGDTWELLLLDDVVQFLSILVCFSEDDHLVEVELVEDVHQLFDLLVFFKLDEVLLQSVEIQFSLTLDDEFVRLLHVESAHFLGGFRQGGGEHHNLQALLGRILRHEDFLDLLPHCGLIEHLVALVQNEMLQVIQLQDWVLWWCAAESLDSTWSTYYDMWGSFLVLQNLLILLDWDTAEEDLLSNVFHVL